MQRNSVFFWGLLTLLTLVFVCRQPGALAETKDKGMRAAESQAFAVPQEQKQAWEDIQSFLQKDYNVCLEHCGSDASCEEKCEKAFNYRKEIEYNKLMRNSPANN
ncbi:MAG: hypothetical protein HY788_03465 [Deltaproteobacteria bacterium]|nr:hypothetical protein [Deltaproteobacteria bacterium]